MNSYPLVSIIIPVYNSERYIKEAVESALRQTYKNIEVIVIDDGSTDNTRKILEPYIKNKSIIYLYQENKGVAASRNKGILESTGSYISFLDSDDKYYPEKIEKQTNKFFENPNAGVIVCFSDYFYNGDINTKYKMKSQTFPGEILKRSYQGNFINTNTVLINKKIIKGGISFDEALRISEDWDLWIRIMKAGVKFVFHDDVLVSTRMRKDSLQSNLVLQRKSDIYVIRKHLGYIPFKFNVKLLGAYILEILPLFLRRFLLNIFRYKTRFTQINDKHHFTNI